MEHGREQAWQEALGEFQKILMAKRLQAVLLIQVLRPAGLHLSTSETWRA